jgi:anti-sigma regulatory factor (Ser/Thr protein kinase)
MTPSAPGAPPPSPRRLSLVVTNERREVGRLMERFEETAREWGLSEDDTVNLNLILDEFVSNVIRHGFEDGRPHEIPVHVELAGDVVRIRIEDDGKPFNPLEAPPPDLDLPIEERPLGGLGIFIARSLADTVEYSREHERNVLTITKRLTA